ncbi:MAG TPA: TonB-dependent receptor, partial [Novosphingobium sp.]|nr:TonB-dependent receptor [Novosphingobium sp.]
LSVAGIYDHRDGIVTDPLTGLKYNNRDNTSVRSILRLKPADRLEIQIAGDYTHQRTAPTLGYATADLVGFNYNSTFTAATPFIIQSAPTARYNYQASTSLKPGQGQRLNHWGVSGTATYDLTPALSLVSITAYRKLRTDYYVDIDATTAQLGDVFVGTFQRQFSQELQLKVDMAKLKGVFGLYYLDEQVNSHQEAYANSYLQYVGTPLNFIRYIDDKQNTKSYAAFGQFTYSFTPKLSLTAGLRYTSETKRYFRTTTPITSSSIYPITITSTFVFPNSLPAPYNGYDHATFRAWTPSATLSYKPTDNTMLYASASRGFKSGGFNGRVNGLSDVTLSVNGTTQVVPTFKPETVWTYEGGAKATFLNGRVQLSGDVFYSDYRDFQARVGGGNTGITGGSFPVINAGKLRIWGIEYEASVRPTDALTVGLSVGYLNAKYLEFNDGRRAPSFSCNPTGTQITCQPAFAPPLTLRLSGDYRIPVTTRAQLTLGGDLRFVGKQWLSVDNRAGLMEPGYWLGNLYAQVDFDRRFYLRGMVKNVTNSLYKTDGQEFSSVGNIQTVYYGDPRTWNLTVGARF